MKFSKTIDNDINVSGAEKANTFLIDSALSVAEKYFNQKFDHFSFYRLELAQ